MVAEWLDASVLIKLVFVGLALLSCIMAKEAPDLNTATILERQVQSEAEIERSSRFSISSCGLLDGSDLLDHGASP